MRETKAILEKQVHHIPETETVFEQTCPIPGSYVMRLIYSYFKKKKRGQRNTHNYEITMIMHRFSKNSFEN